MSETETMTLTDFLLARIAEDEARPDCDGSGEYASCARWSEQRERECAAKRRIVVLHAEDEEGGGLHICHDSLADDSDCGELRALASVYADHPGFRQEWKP